MKRFLVFTFDTWYPLGGWSDFAGDFDTLEGAQERAHRTASDHFQIVDTETNQIIQSR